MSIIDDKTNQRIGESEIIDEVEFQSLTNDRDAVEACEVLCEEERRRLGLKKHQMIRCY